MHEMTVTADSDTGGHKALLRGPIRKQHDLHVSVDHHIKLIKLKLARFD